MKFKEYKYVSCRKTEESGILYADYPPNLIVDISIAKHIVSSRLDFAKGQDHYVIIDMSNVKKVTPEAKAYMQHPEGGLKNILGAAFLAKNPVSALLANIFIKTPKNFEARFFTKQEDAVLWLKECMRKRQQLTKEE
jgi:hypothetical protein